MASLELVLSGDFYFADMLNVMRWGETNDDIVAKFQQLSREVVYTDGIEPTELYPTRKEVEFVNSTRLKQIKEEGVPYVSWDCAGVKASGDPVSAEEADEILDRLVALKTITLKVRAQVMLIKSKVIWSMDLSAWW
ncbi:hypothetical protein BC834DRAFT_965319 [Gloeopeniophorella convolvens]|nr:hypothetical protein BC834DRAFT_965319 [Gloeopeniophorella convolvens]